MKNAVRLFEQTQKYGVNNFFYQVVLSNPLALTKNTGTCCVTYILRYKMQQNDMPIQNDIKWFACSMSWSKTDNLITFEIEVQ